MLPGDLGVVGGRGADRRRGGAARVGLEVGRPVQPMLAAPGLDVDAALAQTGQAAVECKLDGARIQVHRDGDDVRVFTRSLDDITARVPEVVEAVLALPARERRARRRGDRAAPDGRPQPFQVTASRFGTRRADARRRSLRSSSTSCTSTARTCSTAPAPSGRRRSTRWCRPASRVPRALIADAAGAHAFLDAALAAGHEGVVVKALDAPYAAGRRGAGWLKVKPRHTLDLVVLAAEWGHGRRRGWLSNLHLGARDPSTPAS